MGLGLDEGLSEERVRWGAIESRLDVCVDLLVLKTAGTEIDNLDFGMHWVGEQNIFGL